VLRRQKTEPECDSLTGVSSRSQGRSASPSSVHGAGRMGREPRHEAPVPHGGEMPVPNPSRRMPATALRNHMAQATCSRLAAGKHGVMVRGAIPRQ